MMEAPLLNLPAEILAQVLEYLTLEELIKVELVCKSLKEFIRKFPWSHFTICLRETSKMVYVVSHYHFQRYRLLSDSINDDTIRQFKDYRVLYIGLCNRCGTNKLKNCFVLDLRLKLDSDTLRSLRDEQQITLREIMYEITDSSIGELISCQEICLKNCPFVTGSAIRKLSKCRNLHVCCRYVGGGVNIRTRKKKLQIC